MITTPGREGPPEKIGHMAKRCFNYTHIVTIGTELKGLPLLCNCLDTLPQLVNEFLNNKLEKF